MYNVVSYTGEILSNGMEFLAACRFAKDHHLKAGEHCDVVLFHYEWNTEMLSEDADKITETKAA